MGWLVTLPGHKPFDLDDLTLSEWDTLEQESGQSWAAFTPFEHPVASRAAIAAVARHLDVEVDVDKLTRRDLNEGGWIEPDAALRETIERIEQAIASGSPGNRRRRSGQKRATSAAS